MSLSDTGNCHIFLSKGILALNFLIVIPANAGIHADTKDGYPPTRV